MAAKLNGHHAPAPAPIECSAAPPICWGDLDGEPPPRSWWIQDWLGPWPTLIAGSGGAGKTTLWQTIATALATGKPFLGPSVKPINVLMWSCEDDKAEVWRRQHRINAHFGLDYVDLEQLHIVPRMGFENTLLDVAFGLPRFTPLYTELKEQVEDLHADLLVIDNIAQVYGGNENDRHQATMFVNGVGGLITERPFAAVFLGHPGRGAGSEFSGSTAWENAMRMRWYLGPSLPDQETGDDEDDEDRDVMYLSKRKANYSSKDWRRLRFRDGLLLPEDVQASLTDGLGQNFRNEAAERVVITALTKLKAIGINPSDSKNSPDFLPAQIVAKRLHENHSKKELWSAMDRLMGTGKLIRAEIGKYANRMPKFGVTTP